MPPPPDVSAVEAECLLAEIVGREVADVGPAGEGAWSRAFSFVDRVDGVERILRVGRHVEDFEKDRLAAAWATPRLPIPAFGGLGQGPGWWWAITERVHGTPLEALDADGWRLVLPALWAAWDDLLAVTPLAEGWGPWEGTGAAPHPSWGLALTAVGTDVPGERGEGWLARLAASPVGDAPFRAALAALTEVADTYTGPRRLVHGDLLNRNVLVTDDRITGVFDWGCGRWADPIYELALLDFWSSWHPGLAAIEIRQAGLDHLARTGVDLTDVDSRWLACQLHIGLDHQGYAASIGDHANLAAITEQTSALLR